MNKSTKEIYENTNSGMKLRRQIKKIKRRGETHETAAKYWELINTAH